MSFPKLNKAQALNNEGKKILIAAYGFEERSLGWLNLQKEQATGIDEALIIKYKNPKGKNRIEELREGLLNIGVSYPKEIEFDIFSPHNIEQVLEYEFAKTIYKYDEVIVDITAMTKFIILVSLCKLQNFAGIVRIVYSEALDYAPTKNDFKKSKEKMELLANFPSRGFETILRANCLSSIRMQGQPVILVAFTGFNEQLIRHILGTISPHLLLFINGKPPSIKFKWRERATQEIHQKLIDEYPIANPLDTNGLLERRVSTLDYVETYNCIDEIYSQYGLFERIIVSATGSKMQTIGLFFSKMTHSDIHIEYPTPDSYFVTGMSTGIKKIHEIIFQNFSYFIGQLKTSTKKL